jgi:hypothetical protein
MNNLKRNAIKCQMNTKTITVAKSTTGEVQMNMYASIEPSVDADKIAAFLDEPRKMIIKMARAGMITAYPFSGKVRKTYKFRRSEVAANMARLRRPSKAMDGSHIDL